MSARVGRRPLLAELARLVVEHFAQQSEPRVLLTTHAVDRLFERVPQLASRGISPARREVEEAWRDGRTAKQRPYWLARWQSEWPYDARGVARYVWPPSRDRVYVVEPDSKGLVVLTVLVPDARSDVWAPLEALSWAS